MSETNPPTSVLLPTTEWHPACREVCEQLVEGDELLVVCDTRTDPIANRDLPAGVDLVIAGEPVGCSGKANAVAAGMEVASNERIVWTDDDFVHPLDWLATLHADYDRHGPVSETPFFVGRDPLSTLLEPLYALASLGIQTAGLPWAGAVLFERSDLNVESLVADLRRTVSDDGLLATYCEFTTLRRTRRVAIGGTLRGTLERHARFSQIAWYYDSRTMAGFLVAFAVVVAVCLLDPPLGAVALTASSALVYRYFDVKRWTLLLAYPATLLQVPLLLYGLWRRTFVWGGRRYRWRDAFDVEIVDRAD